MSETLKCFVNGCESNGSGVVCASCFNALRAERDKIAEDLARERERFDALTEAHAADTLTIGDLRVQLVEAKSDLARENAEKERLLDYGTRERVRADVLTGRVAAMEEAIRSAPHADRCESLCEAICSQPGCGEIHTRPCDCWKAAALAPEKKEG